MKKSIKLLLAVLILAALIVALKFIPASSNSQVTATPEDAPVIADIDVLTLASNDINAITITDELGTTNYLPPAAGSEDWSIKEYPDLRVVHETLNYRMKQVIAVKALKKIDTTNISEYGLDHPTKTVTYNLKDSTTKTLLIGDLSLDKTSVYVMLPEDKKTVYVLSSAYNNCITSDISAFNDPSISDFNPKSYSIQKMVFEGSDISPVTIALSPQQNGVVACFNFTCGDYKDIPVSNGTVEAIKATFPDFSKSDNFIASNVTDLSTYGLDNPSFHMVIDYSVNNDTETEDGETTKQLETETLDLTYGKTLEDGQVAFIIGNDQKTVYSMDGEFINKFKNLLTPFNLCDKYLTIPNIADVKTIDINFNDSNSSYHIDVDHANTSYSCNDIAIDAENFKVLYRNIIGINADKELDETSSDTTPIVTIKYVLNDGTVTEASYTASTNTQYYQTTLHGMIVGCSKQQFVSLKENLERAIKGEKVEDTF